LRDWSGFDSEATTPPPSPPPASARTRRELKRRCGAWLVRFRG
jgi:hypothetical protein